jgi:hypothetical protein
MIAATRSGRGSFTIPERKMVFAKNPFWERELLACNKFNIYEE